MKFTLEIELGNDAMRTPWDVAGALSSAVMALQDNSRDLADGENGILRDFNGNTVGGWKVSEDASVQPTPAVVPMNPAQTPHSFEDKDFIGFCSVCGMWKYDPEANHAE
jgi:hypothetical protein